ncbi:MAG: hypothetical protein OEY59_13600, partial [Deltaproteobacteria bacterium]|nr:hypothetical protein [Deltaproteobacteria bacterium]
MLPKKHLVCRKTDGLYFFRSSIPKDLGSLLKGKKEFRLSLHTQDLSRASVQAQKYYHVTQGIYQQMRIGHFMTDSVSFIKTWIIQVLENDQKGNLSNQTPYAKRYHDFSLVNDVNMPQEKVATLSEVYQKYKYEMIQVDAWAIKTSMEYDSCVGLAIEVIGDLPMNQIQRSQISRYKEILLKLPANRRKDPRYRELGIQEVIKVHQGPSISVSTVNKHIKCMSALFHWTNRNIHPLDNYFEGLKLHKKVKSNSE